MPYVQPQDFYTAMNDAPVPTPMLRPQLGVISRMASWAREAPWWQVGAALGAGALLIGSVIRSSRSGDRLNDARLMGGPPNFGAQMRRNGRLVRGIVYGPGETGWVEDLGDETWRVDNVPFFSPINVDDVVTIVNDAHGRPTIDRVIDRAFSKKSAIYYPEPYKSNYRRLVRAFERKGWKLEGATPGMAVLAHVGREDPGSVAAGAGVGVTVENMPLRS